VGGVSDLADVGRGVELALERADPRTFRIDILGGNDLPRGIAQQLPPNAPMGETQMVEGLVLGNRPADPSVGVVAIGG
jgi:hypothetical protein